MLIAKHLYGRVGVAIMAAFQDDDTSTNAAVKHAIQQQAILDMVQIMTEFTTSCLIFAVVFEMQYQE